MVHVIGRWVHFYDTHLHVLGTKTPHPRCLKPPGPIQHAAAERKAAASCSRRVSIISSRRSSRSEMKQKKTQSFRLNPPKAPRKWESVCPANGRAGGRGGFSPSSNLHIVSSIGTTFWERAVSPARVFFIRKHCLFQKAKITKKCIYKRSLWEGRLGGWLDGNVSNVMWSYVCKCSLKSTTKKSIMKFYQLPCLFYIAGINYKSIGPNTIYVDINL